MDSIIKIEPRGLWVLIKPVKADSKKLESGLVLPDSEEKEQKAQGIVKAVGNDVNGLEVGEKVIYGAYAGEILKTMEDGKEVEYKLLLDEDIIAKIV